MKQKRILVVDDEPSMRMILRQALGAAGHYVTLASGGEEALEFAKHEHFDVVLMDLLMPGMDGIEAILALRMKDPSIRIVAMSGGWSDRRRNFLPLAEQIGAISTLSKPFGCQELLAAIADHPTASEQPQGAMEVGI